MDRMTGKAGLTALCFLIAMGLMLTGCGLVRFENTQGTPTESRIPETGSAGPVTSGETLTEPAAPTSTGTSALNATETTSPVSSGTTSPVSSETTPAMPAPAETDKPEPEPTEPTTIVPDEEVSFEVIRRFATPFPDSIVVDLKYSQYPIYNDYVLVTSGANIRENPDASTRILGKAGYFEKLAVLAEVEGQYVSSYQNDIWYEVLQVKEDQVIHGYILSSLVQLRTFQFEKMVSALDALKSEVDHNKTGYISNYKNVNGAPPYHLGTSFDAFGVKRYQSAPAYFSATTKSDFRYIADGTLVSIIGQTDTFYIIKTLNFTGEYHVPKRYVSLRNSIDQLTQAIVVDRKNQNEGVFEYVDNRWHMISYIYATTGEKARYKEPTDLGYYMAIEKLNRFLYLDDITRQIAGYAPYAIRFGGGAYVHGVPVDSKTVNGVRIFPAMKEYLNTIGTVPRSHKCVRNYTSHAKFLYDWSVISQAAVIVIE